MRWRARFDDGSTLEEDGRPGGAYRAIDRAHLCRFEVLIEGREPWGVNIHEGQRLVWRLRTRLGPPGDDQWGLVALESEDRSKVTLHVLHPEGSTAYCTTRDRYGPFPYDAPVLFEEETCRP